MDTVVFIHRSECGCDGIALTVKHGAVLELPDELACFDDICGYHAQLTFADVGIARDMKFAVVVTVVDAHHQQVVCFHGVIAIDL